MLRLTRIISKPKFSSIIFTHVSKFSTLMVTLPPNLQIADMKVFDAPPQPNIAKVEYYFPTLDIERVSKVISFTNPETEINQTFSLNPTIFGVAIRKDIVNEMIRYIRNKKRQPHKTKRIGDLAGSNKKPWPQKGQGRAQFGNRRNAIWKGGMKAHGPTLRDFSIGMNRKARAKAMMCVLASKYREGNLIIVDNMNLDTHKTRQCASVLMAHGLHDMNVLLVDLELQENFRRASANIPDVNAQAQRYIDVIDVLKSKTMVITTAALEELQTRLIAQYTHSGKKKGVQARFDTYYNLINSVKDTNIVSAHPALEPTPIHVPDLEIPSMKMSKYFPKKSRRITEKQQTAAV